MERVIRSALLALTLFVFAWGETGCSEERDPITKIQAGAFDKAFFLGPNLRDSSDDPEFYMRTTVVDVQAGAGGEELFTSSDAQPVSRIKWEITEQYLIARLTYELIKDSDHKGARRTNDGQVVATFEIQKHFDVRREYNATTGEELNTIAENDTDRGWYDRQFIRVDWSKNLVTNAYDFDTISQLGLEPGITIEPLAHYVSAPDGPDAPVYDGPRGYLDITHKVLASPVIIHDEEWGDFPACYLVGSWPRESCNPSEVTLRQSFLRVEDHDYEPLDFDGTRMDMFGWFSSDRFGYDRRYGVVDDRWHRFATRWNVFEKSHDASVACGTAQTSAGKDPHRDDDGNGTEDECEKVGHGSRCDEFRGECTLPFRNRKVKTIPWYVSPGFPEDLFAGTAESLAAWNNAIRVGLVAGRLAECRHTKESGCEADMGWPSRWSDDFVPPVGDANHAQVPNVFVLCHNPVDPTKDDAACGTAEVKPRLGDLRYNLITYVDSPQLQSPWGIMVDAEDPLTGEKVSGSVNQWGAVLDKAATALLDMIGIINGDVSPDKIIAGKNVSDWVAQLRQDSGSGKAMSAKEIDARKNAFDQKVLAARLGGVGDKQIPGPPSLRRQQRMRALSDAGRLGAGNSVLTSRHTKLRGTSLETQLVSPEMAQLAGMDPTAPISADAVKRASPFHRSGPVWRRANARMQRMGLAARHSCKLSGTDPDNLLGLAKQAIKLFGTAPNDPAGATERNNKIFEWARQEYNKSVIAHEMGHSMGLRHNFAASFDSLNYAPQYWQLRTKNGTVNKDCVDGTQDGANCIGPRWRDPITQDEIDGNINHYSTTSVMDYPGDANHDMLLPGKYDRAAMRFGYGGVVDVWDKPGVTINGSGAGKAEAYHLSGFTSSPGLFGVIDFAPVDPTAAYDHIHYSLYQREFGLISDCQPSSDPDAVLGSKCTERAMDIVDYRDMKDFAPDPAYAQFPSAVYSKAVDGAGRVRRGYMFSSDEFADSGNVPSFTYDAGADAYEQIRFLEQVYEHRYVLDAFRRNRTDFNSQAYIGRLQSHYLDAIQMISKAFAFGAVLDGNPTNPARAFLDDGNYGSLAMGSSVAFDLFMRTLVRPEPGNYCGSKNQDCPTQPQDGVDPEVFGAMSFSPANAPFDFNVPIGPGRYVHNDFDYGKGYWWSDYQTQAGTYYEKIWSIFYLSEAFDSFVSNSKEDFTDGRYKNVSFATVYPTQTRRFFSSILTGDIESYAPWTTGKGANATVEYPAFFDKNPPAARPDGAMLIDPNLGWNEQLYAMVWGAMFFPTDWSMSFINDARITTLAADQIAWPAAETVTFYDPDTGITYRAHGVGTEKVFGVAHEIGIGARSLEWANKLVTLAYICEKDNTNHLMLNADGTPKLKLDANGHPQVQPGAHAFLTLRKFVSNIDTLRELTQVFGILDNSLPDP